MNQLSRQRRWQLRKQAEGKCCICGRPLATAAHCLKHALESRERSRRRTGAKKRNNSLTYRLAA